MVTRLAQEQGFKYGYEVVTRFIVTETKILGYEIGTRFTH